MPRLNEGDLLIEAVRIPSASLEGAVPASTQIENDPQDDSPRCGWSTARPAGPRSPTT